VGGGGATSGPGGTGECIPTVGVPPVCGSLCGNGVRDTCPDPRFSSCPTTFWTESCDGTDFGADSCSAHGFATGALTCTAKCVADVSGCGACFPLDGSLVRCGPAPVGPAKTGLLAVAGKDAEVGLGLVVYDANDNATLSFARLSPALDAIGVTVLDDHVPPGGSSPAFADLAAAALPSGWVLAVLGRSDLSLRALGADGTETGRAVVDTASIGNHLSSPLLAEQPTGGPLLVWATDSSLRAAVVAADGRSATAPVDLPTADVSSYDPPTAAFVGDAFYVVFPVQILPGAYALRIVRLGLDGTIAGMNDALPGELTFIPNIASGASELRLAYSGSTTGVASDPPVTLWRRLAVTGAALGSRAPLAGRASGLGPSFAFGDDTVVLVLGYNDLSISFARVASDGSIVTPPHEIVRAPDLVYRAARRGPDVVVAWFGPGGLQIARVTP
jgi:hypothetical protein